VPDAIAARRSYPALPDPPASASLCTLPLWDGGEVFGVLGVGWGEPRVFDEPERQLLTTVAGLVAAACDRRLPADARRLQRKDLADLARGTVSVLSLEGAARFAMHKARAGSRLGPSAVFATLLDADPELPTRTLDAVSGVLGLCRRREVPPALVGQAIAEMSEDLDGPITGGHIEVAVDNGWAAVAPLDGRVVIASSPGEGKPAPPSEDRLAGERVVLASEEPAAILVIALDANTDPESAQRVAHIANGTTDPLRDATAGDLLERLARALHVSDATPCVRGALAVVLEARPDLKHRSRRLPAQPVSSVLGRWFAVATLPTDATRDVSNDVELVTDELVANAIRHADKDVVLTITEDSDGNTIAVSDDDDRIPDLRPVGEDAESGRDLAVIEALADDVGTSERAGGGKWVWARLRWRNG
jgi:anti-sigma regulatory factor (Ser/Thr protein kinase)